MPGPITHIVYAQRMLSHPRFQGMDREAFIVGTSFPDVRNVADVLREHTHDTSVSFSDVVSAKTVFAKGHRLHEFVDIFHREYFFEGDEFDRYYADREIEFAWKLIEDELLWPMAEDLDAVAEYFTDLLPEERHYAINDEAIQTWHTILRERIMDERWSASRAHDFLVALRLSPEQADRVFEYIRVFRKDKQLPGYFDELLTRFDALLSSQ